MFGWLPRDPKGQPPRLHGVLYRSRARAEGVTLNLCPWCGEDIRFWMSPEERAKERDELARKSTLPAPPPEP
jgi:hypothetical protein